MKILNKGSANYVHEFKVEFDANEWVSTQEKAYKKLAENIEIKGFRKGQAPLSVAKKQIDPQKAMQEALQLMIPVGLDEIQKENKFELLIRPDVNVDEVSVDKLTLTYVITTKPQVVLGTYKGISVTKHEVEVKDEDVERELTALRNKYALVQTKASGVVAKGDLVVMDFEGYTDGTAFEGGKAERYELEVGSNQFIPGFEDQLIGKKMNEKCEIDVQFPDNYVKELAGKKATFKIFIHDVKVKTMAELNDDLAKDVQIPGVTTLAQLKEKIIESLKINKNAEADRQGYKVLVEQIVSMCQVEVPQTLITLEEQRALENFKKDIESKGVPYDRYLEISGLTDEQLKKNMVDDVIKNLKAVFVLGEIAKENNIQVTTADLDIEYKRVSMQYKVSIDEVKKAYKDRQTEFQNNIFNRKIAEFLTSVNTLS
jgi:trigger factor